MSTSREDMNRLIDAYLDGTMDAEARAAFETRRNRDPELAAELELQNHIDGRLGALMAPPPTLGAEVGSGRSGNAPSGTHRHLRIPTWAKVAAALVLLTLGAWAVLTKPWAGLLRPAPSDVSANVCFSELVKGGLKPMWKCDSDEVFRKYTRENVGAAFTIGTDPAIEVVGWTYASGMLDSSAQVLMCRVDGKPSIIVVGKKSDDREMHVDAGSNVKIHREERCGLVMYELNERCDAPVLRHVTCE